MKEAIEKWKEIGEAIYKSGINPEDLNRALLFLIGEGEE